MIIDTHTHIHNEQIYKDYSAKIKKAAKIFVMAERKTKIEDLLRFAATKNDVFVIGVVNIKKNIQAQLKILEKLFETKKIFGIKLYPGYQYFYPSDKKIYPIAKLCQRYNKPLIFHSGDVYNPEGDALLKYAQSTYVDELAVKFPKCKIIIAHFGFPYFLETANVVSKNENVYTDVSGTIDNESFSRKEMSNMLNQYVADLKRAFAYFPNIKNKVMFGTDYSGEDTPLKETQLYIALVKRVFDKKDQDNVFYKLANKLFFV
jgi:uncharacterized protein